MALTLHGTVSDNTVALDRKTATPLIINGDMQISQRATSVTGKTSGDHYTVDRFKQDIGSMGTWSISQATDSPTGQGFNKSLKMDCTTADASPASSDNLIIQTSLEGQDLQVLKKGTSSAESVTFSFWVKSAKTGTYILELWDRDNDRQIAQSYTISSADTWEKKVLSFAGDTTGALDNDNAKSLTISWWLGAGSDFTSGTLHTSWSSRTNGNRAVGQVNLADSTSNDWYITGIQMEVGSFDSNGIPNFQFEDIRTSLGRCQRYFQKSFPQGTDPQNYSSYVAGQSDNSIGATMSSTEFKTVITLKCEMRSAPTITYYRAQNTPEDSEWTFFDGADKLNPSSMASNAQTHRFTATLTYSSGLTAGNAGLCQGNYSADAEL